MLTVTVGADSGVRPEDRTRGRIPGDAGIRPYGYGLHRIAVLRIIIFLCW